MAAWSAERGWRLVGYSRPGYGESSRQPGRTVADAAADVATILDALGHDRFVVLGWSGGGPHALACAALLPDRCAAAATLAGVAPYDGEGLDWTAGMGAENVEEFMLAVTHPEQLWDVIEPQAPDLANLTGAQVAEMLSGLTDEVDRAALTGEFAEVLAANFRRAVVNGVGGWHDDDLAFARPWGFDLTAITVPVSVWQGAHDLMSAEIGDVRPLPKGSASTPRSRTVCLARKVSNGLSRKTVGLTWITGSPDQFTTCSASQCRRCCLDSSVLVSVICDTVSWDMLTITSRRPRSSATAQTSVVARR